MTSSQPKQKSGYGQVGLILVVVAVVLFVVWLIPLPFKPSPYSAIYSFFAKQSLAKSTDPVYMPGKDYIAKSSFTSYAGWENAYEIQYFDNSGPSNKPVDFLQYDQLSDTSVIKDSGEGPSVALMADTRKATTDPNCEAVEEAPELKWCKYPEVGYLVRTIPVKKGNIYLLSPVFYNKLNRRDIDFVRSATPIPVKQAIKRYFKPQF